MEIWKPSVTLPEYEVSDRGRIRRVKTRRPMPRGGFREYGGHEWPGVWEPVEGRYVFQFKGKTYRVARLVCEAFNGPPPFNGAVCMHRDENSANNAPENLAWGTQKENLNAPGFLAYASRTCRPKFTGAPF